MLCRYVLQLQGLSCKGTTFERPVDFTSARFDKYVSFERARLLGGVTFEGATFSGLLESTTVDFSSCEFGNGAKFTGATFGLAGAGGDVSLRNATVAGGEGLSFYGAVLHGGLDARNRACTAFADPSIHDSGHRPIPT